VPLQARALDALERVHDQNGSPLLFGERGGYLDIHHFRPYQWRPAQRVVGIDPVRRIYDLRHTFATFALRAGVSTFDLSRYMGASLTMIDRHYGHIARDGREHAIQRLDALNAPELEPWTLVDAGWTPTRESAANVDNGNEA
jgi:integrase